MLSLEMHPDRGGDHWDAALINEAYGVLSDSAKRAEYDRSLGASWARTGRSTGDPAASDRPGREPEPETSRMDETCCLFCGSAQPLPQLSLCAVCRSPLTPAGSPHLEAGGCRAARRVASEGSVRYFVAWPQTTPEQGRIVDVSPRGLQFESSSPIEVHRIIKLEGPLLDAVSRVATRREGRGSFSIGVEFYTVAFHQARGTFLSTDA